MPVEGEGSAMVIGDLMNADGLLKFNAWRGVAGAPLVPRDYIASPTARSTTPTTNKRRTKDDVNGQK